MELLEVDKMAFSSWYFYMWQWRICTFWHVWGDVSVVSSQREDKHYYITSLFNPPVTLPLSHLIFSLSVTLPPLLHAHPLPSNSLGGSRGSNWQASRETERKRNGKRERGRGKQWYKKKDPGTRVHIFRSLPCSLFSLSVPPPSTSLLLPPSALLFSLWCSRQIKIQLTDVWLTLGHTIRSHKLFDHNSI